MKRSRWKWGTGRRPIGSSHALWLCEIGRHIQFAVFKRSFGYMDRSNGTLSCSCSYISALDVSETVYVMMHWLNNQKVWWTSKSHLLPCNELGTDYKQHFENVAWWRPVSCYAYELRNNYISTLTDSGYTIPKLRYCRFKRNEFETNEPEYTNLSAIPQSPLQLK